MNCNDIEFLLADALGDELSDADRAKFEAHLVQCEKCRREYESLRTILAEARSLPAPHQVSVQRVGDTLILAGPSAVRSPSRRIWSAAMLRTAAGILIAFAAGYWAHSTLIRGEGRPLTGGEWRAPNNEPASKPLQLALVEAHARNPRSSDLAKGMIAVFDARARR